MSLKELDFGEHVRLRPGMYFGRADYKGIIGIICGIARECIALSKTDDIFFTVSLNSGDNISIEIKTEADLSSFINLILSTDDCFENMNTIALKFITTTLELVANDFHLRFVDQQIQNESGIELPKELHDLTITFKIDPTVFKDITPYFDETCESLLEVTLLNRKTEILVKDTRRKYTEQKYFHFPQGVFYLFEKVGRDNSWRPDFEIRYDGEVDGNEYQIVLIYGWSKHRLPITGFANDTSTICGGSHVNGIISGLFLACNQFISGRIDKDYKITRAKVKHGFTFICSVRGQGFEFYGSTRQKLESKLVYKQIKKISWAMLFNYLTANCDAALQFLKCFEVP